MLWTETVPFQIREGGRENKVYLPDSSLFHIYDEAHQGSACGHPERQENSCSWVGEKRSRSLQVDKQELSNSILYPRFPICNNLMGEQDPNTSSLWRESLSHSATQSGPILSILVIIWEWHDGFSNKLTIFQCCLYTPRRFCEVSVGFVFSLVWVFFLVECFCLVGLVFWIGGRKERSWEGRSECTEY